MKLRNSLKKKQPLGENWEKRFEKARIHIIEKAESGSKKEHIYIVRIADSDYKNLCEELTIIEDIDEYKVVKNYHLSECDDSDLVFSIDFFESIDGERLEAYLKHIRVNSGYVDGAEMYPNYNHRKIPLISEKSLMSNKSFTVHLKNNEDGRAKLKALTLFSGVRSIKFRLSEVVYI